MKKILYGIFLAVVFILGFLAAKWFYEKKQDEITSSKGHVLLNKVEEVCKLVTVEGNFEELYNETNIRQFTFYLPMPSTWRFPKEATLFVRGTVMVGYDMDKIQVSADSASRTILLSNLPEPQVLAIDHQVEYKDLDESWFNTFSTEDYTKLNQNAKEVLRKKAEESGLLERASGQGNQMIEAIRFMVESAGWQLKVQGETSPPKLMN